MVYAHSKVVKTRPREFVKLLEKTCVPLLNCHQNSGFPFHLIAQKGEMGDLSALTQLAFRFSSVCNK